MVCIYCGSKLAVVNSRSLKRSNSTWRRRKCPQCQAIITTIESIDYPTALVFKDAAGAFTAFSRDKLFSSLLECLKHRKAAVSDATALTDTILGKALAQTKSPELARGDIIALATGILKRFDKAAGVQYAAYHPA